MLLIATVAIQLILHARFVNAGWEKPPDNSANDRMAKYEEDPNISYGEWELCAPDEGKNCICENGVAAYGRGGDWTMVTSEDEVLCGHWGEFGYDPSHGNRDKVCYCAKASCPDGYHPPECEERAEIHGNIGKGCECREIPGCVDFKIFEAVLEAASEPNFGPEVEKPADLEVTAANFDNCGKARVQNDINQVQTGKETVKIDDTLEIERSLASMFKIAAGISPSLSMGADVARGIENIINSRSMSAGFNFDVGASAETGLNFDLGTSRTRATTVSEMKVTANTISVNITPEPFQWFRTVGSRHAKEVKVPLRMRIECFNRDGYRREETVFGSLTTEGTTHIEVDFEDLTHTCKESYYHNCECVPELRSNYVGTGCVSHPDFVGHPGCYVYRGNGQDTSCTNGEALQTYSGAPDEGVDDIAFGFSYIPCGGNQFYPGDAKYEGLSYDDLVVLVPKTQCASGTGGTLSQEPFPTRNAAIEECYLRNLENPDTCSGVYDAQCDNSGQFFLCSVEDGLYISNGGQNPSCTYQLRDTAPDPATNPFVPSPSLPSPSLPLTPPPPSLPSPSLPLTPNRDPCANTFCAAVVCPDGSPLPKRDEEDCCGDLSLCSEEATKYSYNGCYKSNWDRSMTHDVSITARGVEQCRDMCAGAGFRFFGFECPHANGAEVHCECSNSLTASERVPDKECQQFNVNSGSHCSGPFEVNGYFMGAGSRNSAYSVTPAGPQLSGCVVEGKRFQHRATKRQAASIEECWIKCQANKTSNGKKCKGWAWKEGASKPCRLYSNTKKKKSVEGVLSGLRNCHPTSASA